MPGEAKRTEDDMTRILLVGYDPQTEDFSAPGRPPGLTAEKIEAGIKLGWSGAARAASTSTSARYRFKTQPKPSPQT